MIGALGALAAGAAAAYLLAPTYYNKLVNPDLIRQLPDASLVALTFDDGPDPRYTSKLLDLLKEQHIKATFFVVAKRADAHPELVERILKEGHCLALHSYEHKNAMVKGAAYVRFDFDMSMEVFRRHGWPVHFYRPPWGHTNPYTLKTVKAHGLTPVLWSVMAEDWSKNSTPGSIEQKLMARVRGGSIICLHDGGGAPDAPLRTIAALRRALPRLKAEGFHFVTLNEGIYEGK